MQGCQACVKPTLDVRERQRETLVIVMYRGCVAGAPLNKLQRCKIVI